MDLVIKNATLEEVTAICYRIGQPNFDEQVENYRKLGIAEFVANNGGDIDTAIGRYENIKSEAKMHVGFEEGRADIPEVKEVINEISKQMEEVPNQESEVPDSSQTSDNHKPKQMVINPGVENELHLEGSPEPTEPAELTLEDLTIPAQVLAKKSPEKLTKLLSRFGARSIPDLNKTHYVEFLKLLKEACDGAQ